MNVSLKRVLLVSAASISLGNFAGAGFAADFREADVETAIQNLYHQEDTERKSAAFKISEMGPEGKAAVPKLIELVQSDVSMNVRGEACNALGKIGPGAASAVPALIAFLQGTEGGYERTYAATALGLIRKDPDKVVPVLRDAMNKDSEPVVKQLAARALGDFGADAKPALPDLIQVVKKGDKDLRDAAASALTTIPADKTSVPVLTEMLGDEIDTVRAAAAKSLGGAGSDSAQAVPKLIDLLTDKNASVRNSAATALGNIGDSAKPAIPMLKKALKDPEMYDAAFDAINNIKKAKTTAN